ncbi:MULTISPECIES: AfsR/SARP family transcriptional regulator [Nocardiopsis]|uniref:Transcriptional regulator n=1 Tax=Nocardiopsis sinuspersici TaxID=501010 RepID=A0A1V3C1Z5_9ACTN|nr:MULTISPECIES: BTAD domain-containing putative transcriptional regulator [Nocardiopsis]OOC54489.1 transcriptional regulator [Nocardiopsis sinuspersici]
MRFSILGPLAVHDAAGRPVPIGGVRLRTLLCLLLLRPGRRLTTEELTDAIWAGSPPSAAGNALQALASRLRRALGEGAVIDGGASGYRLAVAPEQVDLVRFETLARRGRDHLAAGRSAEAAHDLDGALSLWRGPALADLTAHGLAEDTALRLSGTRHAALEDHLAALADLGRYTEVLSEAEALVRRAPHRERPLELLVRALAATGRTADALAAYDRFRTHLADELGLDPSPRSRDLHLRLLRGELDAPRPGSAPRPEGAEPLSETAGPADAPAPSPPLRLPDTLTSFVARDAEVDTTVDLLTRGRLVTLLGPGGAGKTRLAIESASALAVRAPHLLTRGGWFVELASRTAADIPQALSGPLELREHVVIQARSTGSAAAPALERVVSFVDDHPVLLVLDNCEHLVEEVARTVAPLLARCPRLRILTTSREPLGVPGEQLMNVPSLALPPEGATAEHAATCPSVVLFAERAASVRPDFRLTPDNVAHVVRVTRELDGMPLALELAAARLRSMTAAQLADRLGDRFRLLTSGSRSVLPRHRTLRAVVDWSWDLLDESERRLLRRLSVFAGGATLEAVERVCADPGTEGTVGGHDVWTVLFSLVDKSLVIAENPTRDDTPPRYRQLETVRAYAAERLERSGEEECVRDGHARHVRDLWRGADPLLRGPRQRETLARLDAEADNCGAAVRWAVDRRDTALGLDLVEYTQWYWTLGGSWRQLNRWSEAVLDMVGDRVPRGRAVAYASCLFHRGVDGTLDHGAMMRCLRRVEAVLDDEGRRVEEHHMLVYALVYGALGEGRVGTARDRLAAAMDQSDPWMRAMVRLLLSLLDSVSGRVGGSVDGATAALEGFRACGDTWGECQALAHLVDVHRFDDLGLCRELLDRGVSRTEEAGLWGMSAMFRTRRAQVLTDLGELEEAYRDLRALFECEGPVEREHMVLLRLGEAQWLRETGDLAAAREVLDRVGADLDGLGGISPAYVGAAWRAMRAVVSWMSGETEEAWRDAGRAWWLAAHGLGLVCAEVLDVFAVMLAEEEPRRAVLMLGRSEALRGVPDTATPFVVRARRHVRRALGGEEYDRLVAEARSEDTERIRRLVGEWLAPIVPDTGLQRTNRHF